MSVCTPQSGLLVALPEPELPSEQPELRPWSGGPRSRGAAAAVALAINALMLAALLVRPALPTAPAGTRVVHAQILAPRDEQSEQRPPSPSPSLSAPVRMRLVFDLPQVHIDIPTPEQPVSSEAPANPPAAARVDAPSSQAPAATQQLAGDLSLYCPDRRAPIYPAESRARRERGEVLLRVEIDAGGRVSDAQIARSSGFSHLDEAARRAVLGWRCQPPRLDGKSVRAIAMQLIEFLPSPH